MKPRPRKLNLKRRHLKRMILLTGTPLTFIVLRLRRGLTVRKFKNMLNEGTVMSREIKSEVLQIIKEWQEREKLLK